MKTLVIENDPRELAIISQALSGSRNMIVTVTNSDEAWPYIKSGEARFLIANWDTSDLSVSKLIERIRSSDIDPQPYIILTTANIIEGTLPQGMDDIVTRPYKASELKNRVAIAARIVSLVQNLTETQSQLETRAVFDDLTGFLNRPAFLHQAAGELERARRATQPMSMISLDIDNFKHINEAFGIEAGDNVLRFVAQAIREKSRPYDVIGRWTGDEFIIALPSVIGADAEKVSERILAGIRGSTISSPRKETITVKVSAGVASIQHVTASTEVDPLIQQARQAMSSAKGAGGDQVFLVYI